MDKITIKDIFAEDDSESKKNNKDTLREKLVKAKKRKEINKATKGRIR